MLSNVMLSSVMLSSVLLSSVMLSSVMLSSLMLSSVMLRSVYLSSVNLKLVNVYSVLIIGILILILIIFLLISHILDFIDKQSKKYLRDKRYDIFQYYIIKFYNENFDKGISFFNLYFYFLKVFIILINLEYPSLILNIPNL